LKKQFTHLITNYFEYSKDNFIKELSETIKHSVQLKKEVSHLLNYSETPLYLKELLILTIKELKDKLFFKYLKKFILETKNKQLYLISIDTISKIVSYETETFLRDLKEKSSGKNRALIQQSLNNIYKNKNIRMLRVLLSERDDKVLFYKAYEYFEQNPDKKIIPYILPLIIEDNKEIRESALQIIIKTGFCDKKIFEFIKKTIEKLIDKNIDIEYKNKLVYSLSFLCCKEKKGELLSFYNNMKIRYDEIFSLMEPFAYIPFQEKKYKNFYIRLFSSESNDNKFLALKHLPKGSEEWIIEILKKSFKTRVPSLVQQTFLKIHNNNIEELFIQEMKDLPARLKKDIINIASIQKILIKKELLDYYFEEESDELILSLTEYLKKVDYPNAGEIIEKLFFGNLSSEFKKEALKIYLKVENTDNIIALINKLVENRAKGYLKSLIITIITIIRKLFSEKILSEKQKNILLDSLLILFEETFEENALVLTLITLKEFPLFSKQQKQLIVGELKDKQKLLLNLSKDMTDIIKMIKDVEKEIEKKDKKLELKKSLREDFLFTLNQLKTEKKAIFKIREILRKDNSFLKQREREFLKKYILNEIKNPFQKRETRIVLLDLIVLLNVSEAKFFLMELYKQSIPDLKISIKNTLIKLGVPSEEFSQKKESIWNKR
jgi:hypothetical protein